MIQILENWKASRRHAREQATERRALEQRRDKLATRQMALECHLIEAQTRMATEQANPLWGDPQFRRGFKAMIQSEPEFPGRAKLLEGLDFFDTVVDPFDAVRGPDGELWDQIASAMYGASEPFLGLLGFRNELELRMARNLSRLLCKENPWAICGIKNRINYTIGTGHTYQIVAKKGQEIDPTIIAAIQKVLDAWTERNKWSAIQKDCFFREDMDGECILRIFETDEGLQVRFVEPWQLTTPAAAMDPAHAWGVQVDLEDSQNVIAYWIDSKSVDPEQIQHRKRNVMRNVRRGIPTFYPCRFHLRRAENLLKNMGLVAELQASIAIIRKWPSGATGAQMGAFQASASQAQYTSATTSERRSFEKFRPGTILDVKAGYDYDYPGAGIDASNYGEVLACELRAVSSRLVMPEWMLSSDASNANYACHDSETELLTKRGWIKHDQIVYGDKAGTMNPQTGAFEWQEIQAIHRHDYDGEMIRFKGKHNLDAMVTPNHRMYVSSMRNRRIVGKMVRDGIKPYQFVEASKIRGGEIIPFACQPKQGVPVECFDIPGVSYKRNIPNHSAGHIVKHQPVRRVPMVSFLSFLGWWISEGWTGSRKSYSTGHTVAISQRSSAASECSNIRAACEELPYNVGEYRGGQGMNTWQINDKSLWTWLRENCGVGSYTKRLPSFANDLPACQQESLLSALVAGDGSDRESGSSMYFTVSEQLADQVQSLAIQCGHIAHRCKPMANGVIPVSIKKPGRFLGVSSRHVSRVPYAGKVWCVTVPNGLLVTRRNGKSIVTGNSTMVSEGSCVKEFEALSGDQEAHDLEILWRVLRFAARKMNSPFPIEVLDGVDIQVGTPNIIARDRLQEVQADQLLQTAGVLSPQTMADRNDLDYQQEMSNIEDHCDRFGGRPATLAGVMPIEPHGPLGDDGTPPMPVWNPGAASDDRPLSPNGPMDASDYQTGGIPKDLVMGENPPVDTGPRARKGLPTERTDDLAYFALNAQGAEPGDAVGNLHEGGPGSGPRPGEGHAGTPMHNIKVPKSGKISADQAISAMKQMGYELDGGFAASSGVDPKTGLTTHRFKAPNGQTVTLDTRQVKDAVMTGARNYNEAPVDVAAAHAAKWK